METRPLRTLDQASMNRLFEVTDDLGLSREALRVALLRSGEGEVRRVRAGLYEITLPEHDDVAPFLAKLAELIARADSETESTDHGVSEP